MGSLKVDSDGGRMFVAKRVVGETKQNARLAHGTVAARRGVRGGNLKDAAVLDPYLLPVPR